ncbi:MAG: TiaS agmantine-binding domain-containing protein [Halobacteriota archaeon]
MLIGIDDTDSWHGMCTTYLCAVLKTALERHLHEAVRLHLVRLNPTIRFKTRGNAAVGLITQGSNGVKEIVQAHIEDMACLHDDNTHPGAVFIDSNTPPPDIQHFSHEARRRELDMSYAKKLIERNNIDFLMYKKGRGVIGALAAAGATPEKEDHTYELITYRYEQNFKKQRYINRESIYQADKMTYPYTWDTIDHKNSTIVFSPRSRDPVLYGIRGDDPYYLFAAHSKIISEPYEYMALFITNQGTDEHIQYERMETLTEGGSYAVTGTVTVAPWVIEGGHIFFQVGEKKQTLLCVAFEPTKQFRETVKKLCEGDRVTVQGSFINGCLHLEKLHVTELEDQFKNTNPWCCNKRMKSRGKKKGYKCARCKAIQRHSDTKNHQVTREVTHGVYEVVPSARRHLAKPLIRNRCSGYPIFPSR